MKSLVIVSRIAIIAKNRILLLKNQSSSYWSLPGGKWEYESESIQECAIRELFEETGYLGKISVLLWVQEFMKPDKTILELIWLGELSHKNTRLVEETKIHKDLDANGEIKDVSWWPLDQLQTLSVKPEKIKELPWSVPTSNIFINTYTLKQ